MNNIDINQLFIKALDASYHAYAPYSKFKVGAAVVTSSGLIFTGCNVENASYGATICAERVALLKAISEGYRSFEAIAIICNEDRPAFPCGLCLQMMNEFMPEGMIYLRDSKGSYEYKLKELLPHGFNQY